MSSLPPFSEGNPGAYPIDGAPYGATMAYPNMAPRAQIARELERARQLEVRPREISEESSDDDRRRVAEEFAGIDCLYVVSVDGRMWIIPTFVGSEATTHTMAAGPIAVIAAGHILFSADGRAVRWDHKSGHYRPDARQAWEVAQAILTFAGVR